MRFDIDAFVERRSLPPRFRDMAERHYMPVALWLAARMRQGVCSRFGINGGPGTGKSTLAAYLEACLRSASYSVVTLSIDDFYLPQSERAVLAAEVHPLLATRGVPGTHDTELLARCLAELAAAKAETVVALPKFSKVADDRLPAESVTLNGPVDLVILEGWCVGSQPQPEDALTAPINALERERDGDGRWRRWVNEQLGARYTEIFATLDALLYLKAPSFAAVRRWRAEQEQKLAATSEGRCERPMSRRQLARFVQHFERLTRYGFETLPTSADIVLTLNAQHMCVRSRYRDHGDG